MDSSERKGGREEARRGSPARGFFRSCGSASGCRSQDAKTAGEAKQECGGLADAASSLSMIMPQARRPKCRCRKVPRL